MDALERKFGKYAIPNLTFILLVISAAGQVIGMIPPLRGVLSWLALNPYLILRGQIWRLVTWIAMPTAGFLSFLIIAALFYYPIGRQMERVWGDFRYNLYLIMGLVFTVIGAFLVYFYFRATLGSEIAVFYITQYSLSFSPYYVMMSIFFAFAATFPNSMVLFMFIVPVKIKWLGIGYGVLLLLQVVQGGTVDRIVIVASLLNFVIFFLLSQKSTFARYKPSEMKRRNDFKKSVRMTPRADNAFHRCAICGVTNTDFPDMQFRYCSKCNGLYEYCSDHLFTHQHVQ